MLSQGRVECMRNVREEKGELFVLSVRVSEWAVGWAVEVGKSGMLG